MGNNTLPYLDIEYDVAYIHSFKMDTWYSAWPKSRQHIGAWGRNLSIRNSMSWAFKLHDFIHIQLRCLDYHGHGICSSDGIHFVRDEGRMTNRHQDLVQLAIL